MRTARSAEVTRAADRPYPSRMTDTMETVSTPHQPAALTTAAPDPSPALEPGAAALAAMAAGEIPRRYDGPAAWTGAKMRARDGRPPASPPRNAPSASGGVSL